MNKSNLDQRIKNKRLSEHQIRMNGVFEGIEMCSAMLISILDMKEDKGLDETIGRLELEKLIEENKKFVNNQVKQQVKSKIIKP